MNRLDKLVSRIRTDQENWLLVNDEQPITPAIISDGQKIKFTLQFAYSQLLSNILLRMKPLETDKNKLISLAKDINRNSETESKIIHEFQQDYSHTKALWWYTRSSFVDKILNKALRTQDINTIFLFLFLIHDIHRQITEHQCQHPIKVYRSQLMIDDEINNLKESIGRFISIHTFFSTTIDRRQAVGLLTTCNSSNGLNRVLFEIDADPCIATARPFSDITKFSYFPEEREILFSIGSIFRITSVQQNDDQVWIIQMTLCSDDDADRKLLFEKITEQYGCYDGEAALFSFSRVLRTMEKFDDAEKYCHRLLRDNSVDYPSLGDLYTELAVVTASKGDNELSAQWHQKSNKIKTKTGSISIGNSAGTFSCKADPESVPDIASFDQQVSESNVRFTDVEAEKHDILLPIEGHEKMPLVTLEEAVVPLISILPDIRRKVHTAKLKCKTPADGLTSGQSAAIMLYTMEWEPQEQCLYFTLNACLRATDRNKLKPWFLYLKLVLTGLSRLPSVQRTVYRGIKLDISSQHPEDKTFFWWGFSSCTTTINVLKDDQFLGNSGIRTLFHIECKNGKDIRNHSYYQKEDEILLLPATYLEVMSTFEMAPGLHVIQLKEMISEFPYREPVI